jgi:hypothetical protein
MKKIYYIDGPPKLAVVNVGLFEIRIPKEVPDEYADALVKKGTFQYFEEVQPKKFSAKIDNKKKINELNIFEEV